MSPIVETILFIFGLVALGYLSGVTRFLNTSVGDGMTTFATSVALPLLLFRTMAGAEFHGTAPWAFWAAYFCAVIVTWTTGHFIVTRVFGREPRAGVVGGVSSAFSNLVLLGIPFTLGVYGEAGFEILSLLIAVHLPTMLMASAVLFEVFGPPQMEKLHPARIALDFLRKLLRNPLIIGILAGLLWRFTGLAMPSVATRMIDALADIAAPLALFAMGLGLQKFGISGNLRAAFTLSMLKLGLMPAVAVLAAWAFGLPPLTAQIAVAVAALPAGVNSYLIATQFGTGQALASSQMTLATALSAVTLSFWVTVAQMLFA
ncbi:AEC family transporter [Oryzicola mucosus]|uniref:AEC family transporter n=1 Tax=Oryzicola mucosus TaxID=2767425 RepID=A0A8J6PY96_9HYPH|nr:AEC family transporter [Oryzicola mucosus]MBD0416402.1 AEC family transporter [Oryzicola mucosus]